MTMIIAILGVLALVGAFLRVVCSDREDELRAYVGLSVLPASLVGVLLLGPPLLSWLSAS